MSQQEQEWPFRLEMWNEQATRVEEVIAFVADRAVARAAFAEAVSRRPGKAIILPETWKEKPNGPRCLDTTRSVRPSGCYSWSMVRASYSAFRHLITLLRRYFRSWAFKVRSNSSAAF